MRIAQAAVLVDVALADLWPGRAIGYRIARLALATSIRLQTEVKSAPALVLQAERIGLGAVRAGWPPG